MARRRSLVTLALAGTLAVAGVACGSGQPAAAPGAGDHMFTVGRHEVSFEVGTARRTAVLVVPADLSKPVPVVFVFHGHGGSGAGIERSVHIERLWPDAVVAYPDGLVGHMGITDPEGVKPGWQTVAGESDDGDLAFYDAMLTALRTNLPVDAERLYVMGHSNGSAFAALLLNRRGDAIAATGQSSAAPSASLLATAPARSMFLSMGVRDLVVPYARQKLSIPFAEEKLGVIPARATVDGHLRSAPGRDHLALQTYVHPGGHEIPPEVPALIVDFFRSHALTSG